jgi:putative endonuclease
MTRMYYTYVLESQKDGNRYVSYTKNLKSRLEEHKKGKPGQTKEPLPTKADIL